MIPKNDRDFIEDDFKIISLERVEGYVEKHNDSKD